MLANGTRIFVDQKQGRRKKEVELAHLLFYPQPVWQVIIHPPSADKDQFTWRLIQHNEHTRLEWSWSNKPDSMGTQLKSPPVQRSGESFYGALSAGKHRPSQRRERQLSNVSTANWITGVQMRDGSTCQESDSTMLYKGEGGGLTDNFLCAWYDGPKSEHYKA